MQLDSLHQTQPTNDLFQRLAEVCPHLLLVRRPDGSVEYANQRWYEYTHASSAHPPGDNWLSSLHPDDQAQVQELWQTTLQTGQPHETDFRLRAGQTGEYRWFLERTVPLTDAQGRIEHWLSTCTDIDEHKRREETLRQKRDEGRALADSLPQLVGVFGIDGLVEYGNRRWFDYTWSTPEQSVGDNWLQFIHPDDKTEALERWLRSLQTGTGMECEMRIREGKTGEYRWFLGRISPFIDEQGHITKWFGTLTDMHKQKEIEETLQQSRDEFRLVAETLPQLVWVDRPDGSQEFANQRWFEYTGKTAGQGVGEDWLSCYHPDDHTKVQALWHYALLTSKPYEVEARIREGKTGKYRWFLIRGVPVINTYGRVWRWLGTCTDIQRQKQTEEALRESETRFRRFMDANLLGIAISKEGVISEANEAFLSLLGYTRQDLAAGLLRWTTLTPPEYREKSIKARQEAFRTGLLRPYEKEYLTKDGRRVPVLLGGTIVSRHPRTLLAFVLDLTDRKEVERQKELFQRMQEKSDV